MHYTNAKNLFRILHQRPDKQTSPRELQALDKPPIKNPQPRSDET